MTLDFAPVAGVTSDEDILSREEFMLDRRAMCSKVSVIDIATGIAFPTRHASEGSFVTICEEVRSKPCEEEELQTDAIVPLQMLTPRKHTTTLGAFRGSRIH